MIRGLNASDATERSFVHETAVKVRWKDPRKHPGGVAWHVWLAEHGRLVDDWLACGDCLVWEHDGVVLGFVIVSGDVVRCLYVKRDFRGHGIGLRLLTGYFAYHETAAGERGLRVYRTTPSWRAWTKNQGIAWTEVSP